MISKLPEHNNRVNIINMNRFDLEEHMSAMSNLGDDIDTVIHAYGDAKIRPTEDDMLNMLIGIKALHEARYQRMWQTFEHLIRTKVITNKNFDMPEKKIESSPEILEKFQK